MIVRGNRISRAAFTGVRGNAASNLQITGNTITDVGEVAIYSEFGFEGVVIANNTIDGAALGISVTNFNEGGRLAVVQGNLIRNLKNKRPAGTDPNDAAGVGIAVEADASVTGNVIENAPTAGINLGWGKYLRDVSVVGNVVRTAGYGITVSVADGAGTAVIAGNLIAGGVRAAPIVGMDFAKAVTGDLAQGAARASPTCRSAATGCAEPILARLRLRPCASIRPQSTGMEMRCGRESNFPARTSSSRSRRAASSSSFRCPTSPRRRACWRRSRR